MGWMDYNFPIGFKTRSSELDYVILHCHAMITYLSPAVCFKMKLWLITSNCPAATTRSTEPKATTIADAYTNGRSRCTVQRVFQTGHPSYINK